MTQPADITALLIAHTNDGVDFSRDSLHHTLGAGPTQASPGSHTHLNDNVSKGIAGLISSTGLTAGWDSAGGTFSIPGIVNLGNGSSSISGQVNIRNDPSAALTRRTVTLQPVGSQTGDLITVVDSTNSTILFRIQPDGTVANLTQTAVTLGSVSTYAARFSNASAAGQVAIGTDANGGYIQTFGGKPLFLNPSGNTVKILKGLNLGDNGSTFGATLWSGVGVPTSGLGIVGDTYFRFDTPTVALQRIYVKTAAAVWTGVV